MPLTRYGIRNEYSLANPDLYRAAAKNDPKGLLEGVAMAGLVGIVRQLGDLAEFAAEVFYDLHEHVLATAARGHELLLRVQQLEVDIPVVERLMRAETNYVYYAYNPGVEWHANIHNDQNHFAQGDLPRFIRNAYEDCRGPPQLFLLDKFDFSGAGTCLKRYTDPSFFKSEWARLELLKAEKDHQDKRARRIKRKGGWQYIGEFREADLFTHANLRKPFDLEKVSPQCDLRRIDETGSTLNFDVNIDHDKDVQPLSGEESFSQIGGSELGDGILKDNIELIEDCALDKLASDQVLDHLEVVEEVVSLMESVEVNVQTEEDAKFEYDAASEMDQYVDALATMDSEVEMDSELKMKVEMNVGFSFDEKEQSGYVPSIRKTCNELEAEEDGACLEARKIDNGDSCGTLANLSAKSGFESLKVHVELDYGIIDERVKRPFPCQHELIMADDLTLKEFNEISELDENHISPMLKEGESPANVSTPLPPVDRDTGFTREENMKSGSESYISETPQTSESESQAYNLLSAFSRYPKSVIPSPNEEEIGVIDRLNPAGCLGQVELREHPYGGIVLDRDFVLESEPDSIPEVLFSSISSVGATMHPIRWNMGFNDAYSEPSDSDNNIDGMQVSSGCALLSSSTLSSPCPSTLAATIFHIDFGSKLSSLLSSQESSPSSLIGMNVSNGSPKRMSPKYFTRSGFNSPQSPVNQQLAYPSDPHVHSTSNVLPLHDSNFDASLIPGQHDATTHLLENVAEVPLSEEHSGLKIDKPEESPPPPPLPPMEWIMTMKTHNHILSSSKRSSSSSSSHPLSPSGSQRHPHDAGDEYPLDSMTRKKDMLKYSDAAFLDGSIKEEFLTHLDNKVALELNTTMLQPSLSLVSSLMVEPKSPNEETLQSSGLVHDSIGEILNDLPSSSMPGVAFQDSGYQQLPNLSRKDSLMEAIAADDINLLKKVADWENSSSYATSSGDQQVLLEQIRTRSFSLRHTKVERQETPHPVASINVSAILEKANAIRQAFIGSDEEEEEDDWSDS